MNQYSYETNRQLLQDLMRQVNISDIYELSKVAGVARLPIIRIQRGLILNVSVNAVVKIATGDVTATRVFRISVSKI